MQKHVNLVDLVKSFPTNIYLQNLASIQPRTSPIKFAHLAEKSENGSISNLSTKMPTQTIRQNVGIWPRSGAPTAVMRTAPAGANAEAPGTDGSVSDQSAYATE